MSCRLIVLVSVLLCLGGAVAASAQPDSPRNPIDIDLPAQPLAESLNALAQQAGVQIAAPGELVAGKRAPALKARVAPQEALNRLLAGSGLAASWEGAGFVVRQAPAAPSSASPAPPAPRAPASEDVQLPEMQVRGEPHRETAWGPVTGYVATRSATGTKTDTPLLETPQAVSVVTKDQMVEQGAMSVPQALRYTSGVIAEQRGVNTAPLEYLFGRGFQLETYLDGLKQPPVTFRFTVPSMDTYALERAEVLHGPASLLYGQGFPGGIVNLVSKRPTPTPFREVFFQAGSYDRFEGGFDVGGPLDPDGKYLYRLTGLGLTTNTQIDFDSQERLFLAPAFTWRPRSDTSLTLLGNVKYDPQAGAYNLLPREAVFDNPVGTLKPSFNAGDPHFDRHHQTSYAIGYIFDHRFDEIFSVYQGLRYTRNDNYIRGLFSSFLEPDNRTLERFAFFQDEATKVFTVDTRGQAKFKTGPVGHTVVLGVDYQRMDNRDDGAFDFSAAVPPIDLFDPDHNQRYPVPDTTIREKSRVEQVGVYLQDQLRWWNFSLIVGARHDWAWDRFRDLLEGTVTTQSDSAFTWRAGLSYLFDCGLAPYFSYATSFQPTADSDFDGNPFKPTTGEQYELGVKFQPRGINAFITLAAFDLTQNNVLTADQDHPGFSVQTGQVRSKGIELEGHANLTNNLNLILAYTYLHQRVTKSNEDNLHRRVDGIPTHAASGWLDYTFRFGFLNGLNLGAGVRFVGNSAGDGTNTFEVPPYTLVDLAVRYDLAGLHPVLKGAQAAVNVSNLLDEHYVASCTGGFCAFGLQRNVLGTLTYRW
jgi:iron complex outermembrane receptor protein